MKLCLDVLINNTSVNLGQLREASFFYHGEHREHGAYMEKEVF